uniref:Uncharacterized protein n=1 Tax=Prolemur simus TaxID=1328070 RepID=A0A8C9B3D3_PROSS
MGHTSVVGAGDFEEQCRRLDSMAIEALPFQHCLCHMLDVVKPRNQGGSPGRGRCKLANVVFDTFFSIEKYLDHEQKEQVSLLRASVVGRAGSWPHAESDSTARSSRTGSSMRHRSATSRWPRRPRGALGRWVSSLRGRGGRQGRAMAEVGTARSAGDGSGRVPSARGITRSAWLSGQALSSPVLRGIC